MRQDRNLALKLRLEGNSYSQIEQKLNVPKSTLSSWFSGLQLSEVLTHKIRTRGQTKAINALVTRNQKQTNLAVRRAAEGRIKSRVSLGGMSRRDILIAGIALYWAEGYKKQKNRNGRLVTYHPVSLTNSDPKLIKLFLRFLRENCEVSEGKIRANLRIFPHQNEKKLVDFWANITNLDHTVFGKTYIGQSSASKNIRPYNQLPFGVIQIRVSDTPLFNRIMGWIDGLANMS